MERQRHQSWQWLFGLIFIATREGRIPWRNVMVTVSHGSLCYGEGKEGKKYCFSRIGMVLETM